MRYFEYSTHRRDKILVASMDTIWEGPGASGKETAAGSLSNGRADNTTCVSFSGGLRVALLQVLGFFFFITNKIK